MLPYLSDCDQDEIISRYNDIEANFATITEIGQLGCGPNSDASFFWISRLTHVFEELGLRGGFPLNLPESNHFPKVSYPAPPRGAEILSGRPLKNPPYLIKIAKREHAAQMFRFGRVLINPASTYSDAQLVAATRDEELTFWISIAKGERLNERLGKAEPSFDDGRRSCERQVVRFQCKDYYAYCMTADYHYRLLEDFNCDAFVVIYDIKEFANRLAKAVCVLHPKATLMSRRVAYLDPFYCAEWQMVPGFSKNIRYAYQNEWRFVCWQPDGEPLKPFFVELGSLEQLGELYQM